MGIAFNPAGTQSQNNYTPIKTYCAIIKLKAFQYCSAAPECQLAFLGTG
jgi:hypothetical protein